MATTLKDVAEEAGVYVSTASRAVSGAAGVNKKTRERVLAAARRLSYRPNRIARGLVTGLTQTIALIISDIRNPFFAEVARGAEDTAYGAGSDLILCNSDLNPERQRHYVESLCEKRVDGIIMNSVSSLDPDVHARLAASRLPVVLLNPGAGANAFSTVSADNAGGGRLAAQYLTDRGHRSIGHLAGARGHTNLGQRTKGFLNALRDRGITDATVIHGEHSFAGGYEMARALLKTSPGVTAIFCANDVIAFGCLRAAIEGGVSVPQELSIIGFDDVQLAALTSPPLSTIHQPKYDLGQSAVNLLLGTIERGSLSTPEHRLLGVRLVERNSCRDLLCHAQAFETANSG
jgi:LacI family transcriptional regulator